VILLNRGDAAAVVRATWSEIGLAATPASVRDLWTHTDSAPGPHLEATVAPHGVEMFRVR
jgi:alpha-galactosidase